MHNITKEPHIVPETHLKRFIGFGKDKLECLNVDLLRIEKQQSPKSICKGFFHYAIEPGRQDEYSQIVEGAFGDIETWYGDNIGRIESLLLNGNKLSSDDRYGISWVIANFYFRGYNFRKETQIGLNVLVSKIAPDIAEHIHGKCSEEYTGTFLNAKNSKETVNAVVNEELQKYVQNTSYATSRAFDVGFPNTLSHKKWQILINNSDSNPFITGDESVIVHNNEKIKTNRFSDSFLFLNQVFHLSPRIAIIATCPLNEDEHGQTFFEDVSKNNTKIYQQNLLYVNYTNKYCYSANKDFFASLIKFEKAKNV